MEIHQDELSDDLLDGAEEIGEFLNMSTRQVYHLASKGGLAVFKYPGSQKLRGRKSSLLRQVEELEQGAMAG